MNKILVTTILALSFAPPCFAQERTEAEVAAAHQRHLDSQIIVLTEDSARITTKMDKTDYDGGENAILHINLKNVGTQPFGNDKISITDDVYDFYDIDVTNQIGKKVPRLKIQRLPIPGGSNGWGLGPGKTQTAIVWLNNLFDFAYSGKCKVIVSKKFRKDGQLITISSEPTEFEITSRRPTFSWGSIVDSD